MKLGMVGLPNVGKSTLFNALTSEGGDKGAQSANYPFCTIEPNLGIVAVPDPRLEKLRDVYEPDKYTPATIEFMDIAGLVKGAHKGEGLGNKFLADIREADAIIHVARCFEDDNIIHVDGGVNAKRDIEVINLELIFADLEILERRLDKTKKALKGDKSLQKEEDLIQKLIAELSEGKTARSLIPELDEAEREIVKTIPLLSAKPVIYAANLSDSDFTNGIDNNENYKQVKETAKSEHSAVLPISAQTESELAGMEEDEKREFLAELGLDLPGTHRIIRESYALLGLISYFTAGKQEVRAWTITDGTKAPKAAGKIHTDFEKGFIRAEVAAYKDLVDGGGNWLGMAAAKEKGLLRLEGKEYVMKDGDVVLFRFNV